MSISGNWSLKPASICSVGIFAMMYGISRQLGGNCQWQAHTEPQAQVAAMLSRAVPAIAAGYLPLEVIASFSGAALNAELEKRGKNIRLDNFTPPSVGAVAFFDVDVVWAYPGEPKDTFWLPNKKIAGATLEDGVKLYLVHGSTDDSDAVMAEVECSGDEQVFFIPYQGHEQLRGLGLLNFAAAALQDRDQRYTKVSGSSLHYPLVHLKHQPDLTCLQGMNPLDQDGQPDGVLVRALQENSLEITPTGARVSSATAGENFRSGGGLRINSPYLYVQLDRQGMIEFVALCPPDCWRDPKLGTPFELKDEISTEQIETIEPVVSEPYIEPVPAESTLVAEETAVIAPSPDKPLSDAPTPGATAPKKTTFIAFV